MTIQANDIHWFEGAFSAWQSDDFVGVLDGLNAAVAHFAASQQAAPEIKLTVENEAAVMLALAEFIAGNAHPDDPRLEVADAIARHLKLDWPSAATPPAAPDEAMVRDAMRYRWLRDNCYPSEVAGRGHPHAIIRVCIGVDDRHANWMRPGHTSHAGIPTLDTAIDAALTGDKA